MSVRKKIRTYKVKTSWVFEGTVDVRAESKRDAIKIVKTGFNHPTIDIDVNDGSQYVYESPGEGHEGIVDWNVGLMAKKEHIW